MASRTLPDPFSAVFVDVMFSAYEETASRSMGPVRVMIPVVLWILNIPVEATTLPLTKVTRAVLILNVESLLCWVTSPSVIEMVSTTVLLLVFSGRATEKGPVRTGGNSLTSSTESEMMASDVKLGLPLSLTRTDVRLKRLVSTSASSLRDRNRSPVLWFKVNGRD